MTEHAKREWSIPIRVAHPKYLPMESLDLTLDMTITPSRTFPVERKRMLLMSEGIIAHDGNTGDYRLGSSREFYNEHYRYGYN